MDKTVEKELKETFGFVPGFFGVLPEVAHAHAWGIQRDLELAQTALEPKTKELIGLAVAAHVKCRYCTYFHTQAAKAHGANDQELREAILMGGFTVMMSNALNGAEYDLDKFHKEVDRGLQYVQSQAQQPSAH